ncbi:MAG TPA: hypothetical protein VMT18_04250, partial [Planctomycetota bacterium]|nr:hypothetical protein [Planctomycetota bacterium]
MAQRVADSQELGMGSAQAARAGRVRAAVVSLYSRAARSWQQAPAEIARGLREARQLHSRERRFVADAVHAMVRLRR